MRDHAREEVRTTLATKDDLRKLAMWIAGMLVGQIAVMTGVMALIVGQ